MTWEAYDREQHRRFPSFALGARTAVPLSLPLLTGALSLYLWVYLHAHLPSDPVEWWLLILWEGVLAVASAVAIVTSFVLLGKTIGAIGRGGIGASA